MVVDFLSRLDGAARVEIDPHQEMLVMLLRQRCLKYALSPDSDVVIAAVNQLCSAYKQAAIRVGIRTFEVHHAFYEEYVRVQEQVFLARSQATAEDDRPVRTTDNLLNYGHQLLEGCIRRLAALGTFSLDVVSGNDRATQLGPLQYVDLELRLKDNVFAQHPNILARTHSVLFGSVRHDLRNAIAHRRYQIEEDGTAMLLDYSPRTRQRIDIGRMTQNELRTLVADLERAVDTFELSLLIFQHNHGSMLHELGYYGVQGEYSDKQMVEMLHIEGSAAFLKVDDVTVDGETVSVKVTFLGGLQQESGSIVHVQSKDKGGKPTRYSPPIPAREISARDQTLRLAQRASLYARRFKRVAIRTCDLDGSFLGELTAPMELLVESTEGEVSKAEFLRRLTSNTFPE